MNDLIRVADLLNEGRATLIGEDGRREAELLLAHAIGCNRAWLRAHDLDPVPAAAIGRYRRWLAERARGTPVAYLLGEREFWSLTLRVTPDVLIPRADTERLVELALERIPADRDVRVADLGTGSGAIALAIASERPRSQVLGTDASLQALAIAEDNIRRLNLQAQVRLKHGHWFAALADEAPFDVIASNPPYIADSDPHLVRGDLRFEPATALASGSAGLDALAEIIAGATEHLAEDGWLLLEHGHDQAGAVRALLSKAGFDAIGSASDLGGNDRVSFGRRLRTQPRCVHSPTSESAASA